MANIVGNYFRRGPPTGSRASDRDQAVTIRLSGAGEGLLAVGAGRIGTDPD
ncbi:hypothetical protein MMF93_07050 [Streptomyces tubbatahanensis]|uniref:Uncharacterized protein n=1 Tax=Streptomyces tubbatahanensis TaxID=2923272 RepID=A0ABY3XP88_9ACTN|nr:hypothetical protein [Streptomyces tubbatahanensis]UNS96282.1 hypothetical protein MMF93_07050 [Streptomyces tubbatahanensis]